MECKFVVGQKVVCVDDVPRELPVGLLKKGHIYTVKHVYCVEPFGVGVALVELNPGWSLGYYQDRFRPALPHSTDISIFKKALRPTRVPSEVA